MKPAIKKAWVRALRSGSYRKGTGRLKTKTGTFCCLGVLCDLFRKREGKGKWAKEHNTANPRFLLGTSSTSGVLPPTVKRWAGLRYNDPYVVGSNLSEWNDRYRRSFSQIATLIEKHL